MEFVVDDDVYDRPRKWVRFSPQRTEKGILTMNSRGKVRQSNGQNSHLASGPIDI